MIPQPHNQLQQQQTENRDGIESLSQALRLSIIFLYALALIMILVIGSQSFLMVQQHEVGLIYRFGKLRKIVRNGLHLTWPYPIEESTTVEVSRTKKIESKTFLAAASESIPSSLNPEVDGYVLTADKNIIHIKCILEYYVNAQQDEAILNYFTKNSNTEQTLQALFDNAVLKAAAETDADQLLLPKNLRSKVASILRQSAAEAKLGIIFENKDISLQAAAPAQTKPAFDALSQANNLQDKLINEAQTYKIKTVSEAETHAQIMISAAQSDKLRKLSAAKADAMTFEQLLKQFRTNGDLIKKTIYEESMFRIFETVDEKFLVRKDKNGEIRILLSRNLDKGPSSDAGKK